MFGDIVKGLEIIPTCKYNLVEIYWYNKYEISFNSSCIHETSFKIQNNSMTKL